jgi:hypothetical protein
VDFHSAIRVAGVRILQEYLPGAAWFRQPGSLHGWMVLQWYFGLEELHSLHLNNPSCQLAVVLEKKQQQLRMGDLKTTRGMKTLKTEISINRL